MADRKRKPEGQVYPIFAKKAKPEGPSAGPSSAVLTSEAAEDEVKPLSLAEFAALLDFSSVETEQEIATRFDRLAKALLHEFRLVARRSDGKETEFQVLEAEFYLQVEGCHEDPFTHGSEEQRVSGRWYFHRAPRRSEDSHRSLTSTTAYRTGSRKGMDLTFGGPPSLPLPQTSKHFPEGESSSSEPLKPARQLLRGGILIRTLRQLGPGTKVISGPSLLVDQILSASGASSIEELVDDKWERNTSAFLSEEGNPPACLYVKAVESKQTSKIYFSPRIGLDLSHPGTKSPSILPLHPRIRYLPRSYRFFVHPDQLVANGRPQTFLGVLKSCIASATSLDTGLKKPYLSSDIARLTGLKEPTVAKYLAEYIAGRKAGAKYLDTVIGVKGASSSPTTYLKTLGAISTLSL